MEISERTIGEHPLTEEMNNIIDAVLAGENVKGYAFAGAGKSTLLRAVEKYHKGKKGLYICYNKSLEMEARKLFKGNNVDIATSHSFALNSFTPEVKKAFMEKVNKKLTELEVLTYTTIDVESAEYEVLNLKKNWSVFIGIAECFISTASKELKEMHLTEKANNIVNLAIKHKKAKPSQKPNLFEYLVKHSAELSAAMINPYSECPCTHDSYVKHWQLTEPVIKYDYIMFDEAQDSNSVLLSVILKQSCQQIFVGDKFQSIYQFRGGVNAMDIIPYEAFPLSCSFRYGQQIADIATKILNKADSKIHITGRGFDTQVFKGSDYSGAEPFLFIAHANSTLLDVLVECYENKVPAVLSGNKAAYTLDKLTSLLSFKLNNKPLLKSHQRYENFQTLIIKETDAETVRFIELIETDMRAAKKLREALMWSLDIIASKALIHLVTAHMCKGLEYDTVILADDFGSVINSFKNGKPLDEPELNLLYVAVTRPKKTLVIPDELFDALDNNLAFSLKKHKVAKCLLDNLLPEGKEKAPAKSSVKPKPEVSKPAAEKSVPAASEKEKDLPLASSTQTKAKTPAKENKPASTTRDAEPQQAPASGVIKIEVGQCKATGEPLFWCPTDTEQVLNPNIGVAGTMGTGKTQTVKSMITQLKRQEKLNTGGESLGVLIFDYKSDYVDDSFVNATGAKLLGPNNIPINPFALVQRNRLAPMNTAKVFISTLSKIFKLGVKQEQMLKNCILAAYERKEIDRDDLDSFDNIPPTLRDVIAIYNSQKKVPQDSLTSALSELYDFEIFESNARKCKNLYDALDGNIIVVKLGGIDASLQNLIVAVLLDAFYIQMHQTPKPQPQGQYRALKRLILVDEADNFMSQDFPALKKILKEGREFGVGCLLSTQGLDHFQTAENSYSDYMTAWVCHRLGNPKAKDLEQLLNTKSKHELDDRMKEVRELEKHHSLYVDGRKQVTYQESTAFWKLVSE